MSLPATERVRWKTSDLELFPDDDRRYEIIDGELFVTRAPHWKHQQVCVNLSVQLKIWSDRTKLGSVATGVGVIFTEEDNVIPDVVWVSNDRLAQILDESGHLTSAPELVIEVLSPGTKNERRDRELKLKLYSVQGVREYWICDPRSASVGNRDKETIEVYRRENAALKLVATLYKEDTLTSPLLPGFSCLVESLFE
jgi:Uma2 family endonuclease